MKTTQKLTAEKNDPRLCIAGTEHLWSVCLKTRDKLGVSTEVLAENVVHKDAVLFAAAPELLEVVKWVAECLPEIIRTHCPLGVPLSVSLAHDMARDAVKKAEGREEP